MSQLVTDYISPETEATLQGFAREINATHLLTTTNAGLALVFAVRTGILCLQAKALCPHGTFGAWLAENCPTISHTTACNYMRLMGSPKVATLENLPRAELLAPEFVGRIREEAAYRDDITARVRSGIGAPSLARLYESAGVLAPKAPSTPTPNTGARGVYTPDAVALMFTRALRQTVARVPLSEWSREMREAWVRVLQPIADLVEQLKH
jgi:hypothetical protein